MEEKELKELFEKFQESISVKLEERFKVQEESLNSKLDTFKTDNEKLFIENFNKSSQKIEETKQETKIEDKKELDDF